MVDLGTGTFFPPPRLAGLPQAIVGFAALLLLAAPAATAGEKMPEGPPWVTDFAAAREAGVRQGKPIFVYLTKTH
jgi:hypothetical protein